MNASPSVSIAMATYKGGRFLKEQLESLATQTRLPDELVVTDDDSPDNTLQVIEEFTKTAPFPVRLERNAERLGYKANFFKAASLCRSDIITFCDQDDVWLPKKIEACLASFANEDVLLSYHNALITTESLQAGVLMQKYAAPATLNGPLSLGPWFFGLGFTLFMRRSLLAYSDYWQQSADFFHDNCREAHDQWFFFLASSLGTIAYIDEPFVLYRQHHANTFGWNNVENTMRGKFKNLVSTTVPGIGYYAASSRGRVYALEQIAGNSTGMLKERAFLAADRFRQLEFWYRARQDIYRVDGLQRRLSCFLKILNEGGYKARKYWGVGKPAMMRDIVRGVFIPIRDSRAA